MRSPPVTNVMQEILHDMDDLLFCLGPFNLVSSPGRRKTVPFLPYSLLLLCQQRYMLTEIRRALAPETVSQKISKY